MYFHLAEFDRVKTGKTLYILNIGDRTNLLNGYRYIKELLMQYHNFYFNNSYDLLVNNGVPVFSVKTDAFTIRSSDLEKASKILNILNER
jgi:hypothetical protein